MREWVRWVATAVRLVVGGVWIAAAAATLTDPLLSGLVVRAYDVLPGGLADQVGQLLPPLEAVIAIALVVGLFTRGAALVSVVVLTAYVVAAAWAWAHGTRVECGCFGAVGAGPANLVVPGLRDLALLALSGLLVWRPVSRWSLDGLLSRRTTTEQQGRRSDGVGSVEA